MRGLFVRTKGLNHECGKKLKLADMKIDFVSWIRVVYILREALDGRRKTPLEERQSRQRNEKGQDGESRSEPEFEPTFQNNSPTPLTHEPSRGLHRAIILALRQVRRPVVGFVDNGCRRKWCIS